jgi:2-oxo-4-hydroxy-4-carboxy-5-ureidoimidazoline decarboxylase
MPPDAQPAWLAQLNTAADPSIRAELTACCAAPAWTEAVLAGRPYAGVEALLTASDAAIAGLDDDGLTQALAAHPRIGERAPAAGATAQTPQTGQTEAAWSRQEQAGMGSADDALRAQIADANRRYEQRFDRVYLVCATGLSAERLLATCLSRLDNDDESERATVLTELAKIVRIRLGRLLHPDHAAVNR